MDGYELLGKTSHTMSNLNPNSVQIYFLTHYEQRIKSLMRKRAAVPPDAAGANSY